MEPNYISTNSDRSVNLKQTSYTPITIFDLKTRATSDTNIPIASNNSDTGTSIDASKDTENIEQYDIYDNEAKENLEEKNTVTTQSADPYKRVEDYLDYKIVGEIFDEFIILEKGENMLLLDFHAGHERLNYDKFTSIVENRQVVVQDLLIPYVQEMTETEVDFILSLKNELNEIGFDIDSFGDKKIIINSVPMQLKDISLKDFVDDLIHDMKNLKPKMNNEIRHYLMQKACKSSVKSGMRLSEMEIKELLKNLDINNPVLLCPHGRPILTVISRQQIEKWFKRIV